MQVSHNGWIKPFFALFAISCTLFTGCGASGPSVEAGEPEETTQQAQTEQPADPLHLPFDQAIRANPPENGLPPVQSIAGKSVGMIYVEVEKLWPEIRFKDAQGKVIQYQATMETDAGSMVIELMPEAAPNHVRSFIALAKAGYYDGLYFEEVIGGLGAPEPDAPKLLLGGSPEADGNDLGSVGYWLLPEIPEDNSPKHVPGTVGACRSIEPDTACCRFYITLTEAPVLDGQYTVFGKITKGLDVAQVLFDRLDRLDDSSPTAPQIRKVTVQP